MEVLWPKLRWIDILYNDFRDAKVKKQGKNN
jgi:hypothetical protein